MSQKNQRAAVALQRHIGSQRLLHSWGIGYVVIISMPLIALLGVLAVGAIRERNSRTALTKELDALRSAGEPASSHDLMQWFDRHSSTEQSRRWRDIMGGTEGLAILYDRLTWSRIAGAQPSPAPNATWPTEPIYRRYHNDSKALISTIAKASANSDPVWQPISSDGTGPNLSDVYRTNQIIELLNRNFDLTIYDSDPDQAMQLLGLVDRVSDAFDWQIGLMCELYRFRHQDARDAMIRRSLQFDAWRLEDLSSLDQRLASSDAMDARWYRATMGELASLVTAYESASTLRRWEQHTAYPFGVPATTRLWMVRGTRQIAQLPRAGSLEHVRRVRKLVDTLVQQHAKRGMIASVPFASLELTQHWHWPFFDMVATTFAQRQMHRRWTRVAVGIKRYQLQQGRWPENLQSLSAVGLTDADLLATETQPFGYRIIDDSEVWLWTLRDTRDSEASVPPDPPLEESIGTDERDKLVVRIR